MTEFTPNAIAPLIAVMATITTHLLPCIGVPAILAGFIWKAVQK